MSNALTNQLLGVVWYLRTLHGHDYLTLEVKIYAQVKFIVCILKIVKKKFEILKFLFHQSNIPISTFPLYP